MLMMADTILKTSQVNSQTKMYISHRHGKQLIDYDTHIHINCYPSIKS